MKPKLIVGVMGGGDAQDQDIEDAYNLGRLIAGQDWILLNGGRDAGIMAASAKGASENGGLTVGILPDSTTRQASQYIHIPILTGMGNARNCINILSSDVVVACPGGMGTLSEIALALKCGKQVILLNHEEESRFARYHQKNRLFYVFTPDDVIDTINNIINNKSLKANNSESSPDLL